MTFEKLEAEWALWHKLPSGCEAIEDLHDRCPPIGNAAYVKGNSLTSGVAIINSCIMLNYDDITL